MKHLIARAALAASLWTLSQAAYSSLSFTNVSGVGEFEGLDYLTDGIYPTEGTGWQTGTLYWTGTEEHFILDLGGIYEIDDITLSVDNNDDYLVQYSSDSATWTELFTVDRGFGNIAQSPGGMDTMSTLDTDAEYIAGIDFSPITARYFRIEATGGDGSYSLGEFEAHATSVVPIPAAVWLFGSALMGMAGFASRQGHQLADA